jgi:hypothetical protein
MDGEIEEKKKITDVFFFPPGGKLSLLYVSSVISLLEFG